MIPNNPVNANTYLIKGILLRNIFNNHIRKLSLGSVGVIAEDFLALFLGSDCEYSIKARERCGISCGISIGNIRNLYLCCSK